MIDTSGEIVFDFVEANDLLLAAFRQPLAFVLAIAAGVAITLPAVFVRVFLKKRLQSNKIFQVFYHPATIATLAVVYSFLAPSVVAARDGSRILEGRGTFAGIEYVTGNPVSETTMDSTLTLVTTTDKYLILFNHLDTLSYVVPTTRIARMRICDSYPCVP